MKRMITKRFSCRRTWSLLPLIKHVFHVILHIKVLRIIAYPPTKSGFKCSVIKSVKKIVEIDKTENCTNRRGSFWVDGSMTDLTTERTTWPCPRAYQSAYSFVNTTKNFINGAYHMVLPLCVPNGLLIIQCQSPILF